MKKPTEHIDIVVIDVSFISLREILPHIASVSGITTQIVAMVKPQFEAGKHQVNKGVIKNDAMRRDILKDFEAWVQKLFLIVEKADSEVSGAKGNTERFYLLNKLS
jgi:23S rRNA (cytidine1920-2'-O)/16S rRNA (cytidine1409-2'-O)-methyltransferase